MSSPPASPISPRHRRQSSNFSMSSSNKRLSGHSMTLSRRSSAFGSSIGPGGDSLAAELEGGGFGESLADELNGFDDDEEDEAYLEDEEEDERVVEQERDSGIDVASSPTSNGKHLSPKSVKGHRRKESRYDGSEYGSESDFEETELVSAGLEARMAAVEAMARRGLEENGSANDEVVARLTKGLKDFGSQGDMEMGVTRCVFRHHHVHKSSANKVGRLSTAYTALSTHLANQTRILAQLASYLMSPLSTILISPDLLADLDEPLDAALESIPTLMPSSKPPQSLHILLTETAELIQDLNYLKDTLQVNQQTTLTASRRLKAAKDVLRETQKDIEEREASVAWIEQGGWGVKLEERRAAADCANILGGFEKVCDGWGQRILAQEAGIGVAM